MRKLLLLGLILGFEPSAAALGADPILGVEIEVRAREVAPGEPLRVVVRATEALAELQGLFLGEPIFLTRSDPGEQSNERESWNSLFLIVTARLPATARPRVVVPVTSIPSVPGD